MPVIGFSVPSKYPVRSYCWFIVLLFLLGSNPVDAESLPDSIRQRINLGIELTINQQYDRAEEVMNGLEHYAPCPALRDLYLAAVVDMKMVDRADFDSERRLLELLDHAREQSDTRYAATRGNSALFIRSSAELYLAHHYQRRGEWLAMYRNGVRGVEGLEQLLTQDSTWQVAKLGLGNYLYWKSRYLQKLTWLPFVTDDRRQGIDMLLDIYQNGDLGRWVAASNLTWILLDYGRPEQALEIAQAGLERFPNSTHFRFPEAQIYWKTEKYDLAKTHYEELLTRVEALNQPSRYNEIFCLEKLTRICIALDDPVRATQYCARGLAVDVPAEWADISQKKRQSLQKLKNQLENGIHEPTAP